MKKNIMLLLFCMLFVTLAYSLKEKVQDYSLDVKIGQMLMFGFRGTDVKEEWVQLVHKQITENNLGGILVINYNIKNPNQTDSLMSYLHSAQSEFPVLFAIDQEGGFVQRLSKKKGFKGFPSAQQVADSLSIKQAFETYKQLARECKQYGFNYILAPVVDVNVNPNSPAIGAIQRSYSKDPRVVTTYADAFIKAIESEGLISCIKHFPGHGSATNDSHQGLTDVSESWQAYELDPYRDLIKTKRVKSIMSSHIFNNKVDSLYPASLSEKHILGTLRKELNFQGVVITDDLQMGAINNYYSLEEIVLQAIKSGSDLLVFSQYFNPNEHLPEEVIAIIKKGIQRGEITEERINESFRRIQRMKKE